MTIFCQMIAHGILEYVCEKFFHFKGNPSDRSIKTFKEILAKIYRNLMKGTRRNALDFLYRSASIRSLCFYKLQLHTVQPRTHSPISLIQLHSHTHSQYDRQHTHALSRGFNRSTGSAALNGGSNSRF